MSTDPAFLSRMNRLGVRLSWFALSLVTSLASLVGCGGSAKSNGSTSPDGGASSPTCGGYPITFNLLVDPSSTTTYCVATSAYTCGLSEWLSVRNAEGTYLTLDSGTCTGSCSPCTQVACSNLCLEPEQIGTDGVTSSFDGVYFMFDSCGAGTRCADSNCAPAGNYVARMCGTIANPLPGAGTCTNVGFDSAQDCVEIPFKWPPAASGTTITGTLGAPADGGAM